MKTKFMRRLVDDLDTGEEVRISTQKEAEELNSGTTFIVYGDDPVETVKYFSETVGYWR